MNPGYELKDELARFCLPAANQDSNLKLAWVNSICILFLCIGILGARRGVIAIKPVPPIREEIPVVVQPAVLPPQAIAQKPEQAEQNNQPRVSSPCRTRRTSTLAFRPLARSSCLPRSPPRRRRWPPYALVRSSTPARAANDLNRLILPSPCKRASKARWFCCSPAMTRAMSFPWT